MFTLSNGNVIKPMLYNNDIWLSKQQIMKLYGLEHEKKRFQGFPKSCVYNVKEDGLSIKYFNLNIILLIGFRCNIQVAHSFLDWAKSHLNDKQSDNDDSLNVLRCLDITSEHVFDKGQTFNAYCYVLRLIKSATSSIVVIDNYADEDTLLLVSQKNNGVSVTIFVKGISEAFKYSIAKYKEQYGSISVKVSQRYHDRFVIIDNKQVYHLGCSIHTMGRNLSVVSPLSILPEHIL